jgi:hypothetical protein
LSLLKTPSALIRKDLRDGIYGVDFRQRVSHMDSEEVIIAIPHVGGLHHRYTRAA